MLSSAFSPLKHVSSQKILEISPTPLLGEIIILAIFLKYVLIDVLILRTV